jgi:hypothetical protein
MVVDCCFPASSASPAWVIQATTSTEYCASLPNTPLAQDAVGQCRDDDPPHAPKRKFVDQKARHRLIEPHKQVSFSPDMEEIIALPTAHHDHCTDTYPLWNMELVVDPRHSVQQRWYSRAELDTFKKLAHTSVLKFHKTNAIQVKAFCSLLVECSSSSSSSSRLLVVPDNAQKVLRELESSDMRGLEAYVHRAFRERRHWHVKSLVAAQTASKSQKLLSSTTTRDSRERLLRSVSMRSSRASKIIARLLGHGDAVQVASMVREELEIEQRCPVGRAS